jgi:hypothetical protein
MEKSWERKEPAASERKPTESDRETVGEEGSRLSEEENSVDI